MRVRLVVAYDGTDFCGWWPQSGLRTVQGTLTEAVRLISGEETEIFGASRTDSGAHALGQVCHFDTRCGIPPEKWGHVLRQRLPRDIAVVQSNGVEETFHSRFSAESRQYRYRIGCGGANPLKARYVHQFGRALNLPLMVTAAAHLQGSHDFRSFTEELDSSITNTVRTLFRCDVKQVRDEVWVDVTGTAFLRGMMRRIAGALLEVGREYRDVEEVSRLLQPGERDGLQLPVVLPARGLCLLRVRYGRHPIDRRTACSDTMKCTARRQAEPTDRETTDE